LTVIREPCGSTYRKSLVKAHAGRLPSFVSPCGGGAWEVGVASTGVWRVDGSGLLVVGSDTGLVSLGSAKSGDRS
jgi:hypothetical protein